MTAILGISAFYHDSAAALVVDGHIVAAAQEERFTRKKHDPGFPAKAIEFCLQRGGVPAEKLDYVAFYDKPLTKFDRLLETYLAYAPAGFKSFRMAMPVWLKDKIHMRRTLQQRMHGAKHAKFVFTDHHESHAASAFLPSPFERAAILTVDGVGEWSTATYGLGEGNKVHLLKQLRFPHSLGLLYSAFTYYCGFKVNSGEYKLMGLAPYGSPIYRDVILKHLIHVQEDGSFWMNMDYFNYCQGLTMTNSKFDALFGGPPRHPESVLEQRHMDIAASVQKVTEEVVLAMARHLHCETQAENLVMAGGVALNCVANGRLLREGPFKDLWVQPAAGDAGGALGAAMFVWFHLMEKPRRTVASHDSQQGSLLGPEFKTEQVENFLHSTGASYERLPDEQQLLSRVASMLAEGKIIGWFHGRMEFGPRALGARSILGDARNPSMQAAMNLKIKFRESFRPFAPCVLREKVTEYFDVSPGHESPYMLIVAPVSERHRAGLSSIEAEKMANDPDLRQRVNIVRSTIPAVTHVDYSARIQTVDEKRHGRFYRLLTCFEDLTGCPVIVNTSFNVRGEPIVCTPEEAYRCFMATEMDALVLEDCVLTKEHAREKVTESQRNEYLAQFQLD